MEVRECKNLDEIKPLMALWAEEASGNAVRMGISIVLEEAYKDFQALIDHYVLLKLVDDNMPVGFMGVEIFKNPLGYEIIANEHYWFVAPEHRGNGLKLKVAAFAWAKEHGCSLFLMNASRLASKMHDIVCQTYEKENGMKFETTYLFKIGG